MVKDSLDKAIAEFRLHMPQDKQILWVSLYVRKLSGQAITLWISQKAKALDLIHQTDTLLGVDAIYKRPYRPQYYFSLKRNWRNDLYGLFYYKGMYHLLFQL